MNRNRLAVVVFTVALFTAAFAATASANAVGTMEVYGWYAKSSTEMAPPSETLGGGLTFGAGYYRNLAATTMWGIEAAYDNLGSKDWDDGLGGTGTTSASMFRVSPQFRLNFGAPVGPSFFGQAGFGYYNVSASVEDNTTGVTTDASDGKFGFNIGAGVGFPVGPKTKLSFSGNYHSVSTEVESTNYLNVRAGLGFGL